MASCVYLMRCNGERIPEKELQQFGQCLRGATENALAGEPPDENWVQATLRVDAEGIGQERRQSSGSQRSSRVGSRQDPSPYMFQHMKDKGLAVRELCDSKYDDRTEDAVQ